MYDELIAELRQHHCDAKEDDTQEVCEECSYDVIIVDKSAPSGFASVCVCGLMNRAADAIEKLSKPRWIPVTERLPEINKYVLGCFKDNSMTAVCFFNRDEHMTFWRACTDEGWEADCDSEPTHWMPLPEPPKEEIET